MDELGCTEYPCIVLQLGNISNQDEKLRYFKSVLDTEATTAEVVTAWVNDVLAGKVPEDDDFETDDDDIEAEGVNAGVAPDVREEL